VPNGGNPQKVQRYISDWSKALKLMMKKDAEIMIPGHGLPIYGKDRIQEALSSTADFLKDIEDQTLKLMNQGKSLNEVFHQVKISSEILNKPWLRPVYDDPKFLIKMIWRRYGGWWDGEYDRLLPDTRENEAKEWIELSGGVDNVIKKALDNLINKKFKLAAHLIEVAFYADKENKKLHDARKEIYAALSKEQDSSMARNIFNHANLASNELKRDLASED
jgi:alkyl sulfatase BDS1-like metallo-beta-lactamase superfamily hydrolase